MPIRLRAVAKRLEDFRDRPGVGTVAYTYAGSDPHPLLFHDTAQTAFYVTLDALNRFQSLSSINANHYVVPALGLWFIAAESYISTVYKVAQLDAALRGASAVPERTKLLQKYVAIEDHFGAPIPRPSKPRIEFAEFCTMRNLLFHDLTGVKRPKFHHSLFTNHAENANEVDLFQGVLNAIDVFTYFRLLFPGTDLMPSIFIQGAHEKIDTLTDEILCPAFADLLAAKELTTALDFSLGTAQIDAEAGAPLVFLVKATSDAEAPVAIPTDRPSVAWAYVERASEKRPVDDDKFELPRYTRR